MGFGAALSALVARRGRTSGSHRATAPGIAGDTYDFALPGSLDRRSAPGIRKVMLEEALRHREVRIDLSGLRLVDSAGLAILVEVFAAARRGGVEMVFHRPTEPIRRVLHFTRLDQVFPISDSSGLTGRVTGPASGAPLRPSPAGA